MKKFFYTLTVVLFASLVMISCADEDVKVKGEAGAVGGSGSAVGF